jgi:hypothetical protein
MGKKTVAQRRRRVADTRNWRARRKRGASVLPIEIDGQVFDLLERFVGFDASRTDDKQAAAEALGRLWRLALAALQRETNAHH